MYNPIAGRWHSTDPIGVLGNTEVVYTHAYVANRMRGQLRPVFAPEAAGRFPGVNVNLYAYTNNMPTNAIDPSGQITRVLFGRGSTATNGGFTIRWKFSLDRAYTKPSVIVQRITVQSRIWPCETLAGKVCCNHSKRIRTCRGSYFELIGFVQPDSKSIRIGDDGTVAVFFRRILPLRGRLPPNSRNAKHFDDTWRQLPTKKDSCGIHQMRGEVKVFRLTTNILAQLRRWVTPVSQKPGPRGLTCQMTSGSLLGTSGNAPGFWDKTVGVFKPREVEKPPTTIRAVWDCPPAKTSYAILSAMEADNWPNQQETPVKK